MRIEFVVRLRTVMLLLGLVAAILGCILQAIIDIMWWRIIEMLPG